MKFVAKIKNKNEANFKLHDRSAISHHWFDIDFYWIELNFSTREPDFYKGKSHDNTQDTNKFAIYQAPIGNSKYWGGG